MRPRQFGLTRAEVRRADHAGRDVESRDPAPPPTIERSYTEYDEAGGADFNLAEAEEN